MTTKVSLQEAAELLRAYDEVEARLVRRTRENASPQELSQLRSEKDRAVRARFKAGV